MFLILAVGPLLIVGLFIGWQSYQSQLIHALSLQKEISRGAAVSIQSHFNLAIDLLEHQATINDLPNMPVKKLERIFSFLTNNKTKSGHRLFQSVALIDEQGILKTCSAMVFYCSEEYFKRYYDLEAIISGTRLGQLSIGQLIFDEYSGEPYLTLAIPIIDLQTGLILGILTTNIRFKEIWTIISDIQKKVNGQIYVIDQERRIVAHADPTVVLKQTILDEIKTPGLQKGLNGEWVIMNQTAWNVGNQTLHVIAEQSFQDAMSLSFRILVYLAGAIFAGLLSVLAFALIAERRFVQPVEKLTQFATNVKNGNLRGTIAIDQNDELGDLARIVNEMTENLSGMVTRLQETIQVNNEAFDALSVSENRFKAVFDNARDSIIIADTKTRKIISVNEASCEMFGFDETEMLGMSIESIHPESAHEQAISAFEQIASRSVGSIGPLPMKRKDGGIFFSDINTSTFIQEGRKMVISLLRDVTQQKMTEQKLKEARDSAEAASKAKSQFLANISHEIRTPLNSVIGYSELLEGILKDEKQKRHLASIKTAGRNLLTIINDILDLSKIEAGMMTITPQPTDLKSIFNDIKRLFEGQVEEKGLTFELEFQEGLPKAVITDSTRLRQILINLLGNAVKYTDKGFINMKVGKTAFDQELNTLDLSIIIEDSGIGIPQHDLDIIFESFRQQDAQSNRKFEGTGLGLSICKKLVELLNGVILVESTVGEGSRFEVILHNLQSTSQAVEESLLSSNDSNINYNTGTVLTIDDEPSSLYILDQLLKKMGLRSVIAINGKDGLNLAGDINPDLVILDISMPETDGLKVAASLKSDALTQHIPLIAVSNSADQFESFRNSNLQIQNLLSKPLNIAKLVEALDRQFERAPDSGHINNQTEKTSDVIEIDQTRLLDLNKIIKKKYLPWIQQMKGVFKINDVKQFSSELAKVGDDSGCSRLVDCSSRLMQAAKTFDISAIHNCLSDFQQLAKALKQQEQNNG